MKLSALARALIRASEKAANIAREMRSDQTLFDLLVEEKVGDAKNKRFVQDFKTLGDVLVQEMVRHDLAKEFPGIADQIYGEESNKFTNTLGESLVVQVLGTEAETRELLATVLDGSMSAASVLAKTVHQEIPIPDFPDLETVTDEIDAGDIGIWIDPIDSTAQFIHGYEGGEVKRGVHEQGLQCVVVIIGVYNKTDGLPMIGVCNQPFSHQDRQSKCWHGRCLWGLCYEGTKRYHIPKIPDPTEYSVNQEGPAIVMSSSERVMIQDKLREQYEILYAAGAGYKITCVLDKLVLSYVLSSGSTFKWDTCGPHALIRAMDGDIINLQDALSYFASREVDGEGLDAGVQEFTLRYNKPDCGERPEGEKWSNAGGLVAYLNKQDLLSVVSALKAIKS